MMRYPNHIFHRDSPMASALLIDWPTRLAIAIVEATNAYEATAEAWTPWRHSTRWRRRRKQVFVKDRGAQNSS